MNIPLLHRLRANPDQFVPLVDLGSDIDGVRRAIDELESFGFSIEHHPYRGVAYRGHSGRLCPDQIEYELNTERVGRRIAVWNRVSSTNDLAAGASASPANDGLVVLAEEQTAGRGRRGRVWTAPPRACVLMSVLLFPPAELDEVRWLTALGAVAVADVVAECTGREPKIKWPNDVRVDQRKIAGVLVERGAGAVIGIGLNANLLMSDLPDELQASTTSLRALLDRELDRSELAKAIIQRLDYWYLLGRARGAESLSPRWRSLSEHVGNRVHVITRDREWEGVVADHDLIAGLTLALDERRSVQLPSAEILDLKAVDLHGSAGSGNRRDSHGSLGL